MRETCFAQNRKWLPLTESLSQLLLWLVLHQQQNSAQMYTPKVMGALLKPCHIQTEPEGKKEEGEEKEERANHATCKHHSAAQWSSNKRQLSQDRCSQ